MWCMMRPKCPVSHIFQDADPVASGEFSRSISKQTVEQAIMQIGRKTEDVQ